MLAKDESLMLLLVLLEAHLESTCNLGGVWPPESQAGMIILQTLP